MTEKEQATSPALDADRQGKAKQYARIGGWLFVVSLVISALYAALWLALGVSTAVKGRLLAATHNPWLLVAGYGLVFGLVYTLLTLPLSYYSGFVLPHRYGQSTQTFGGWVGDLMKGLLVGGLLGGLVLEGVYWLLRAVQDLWWLWAGLGYLLFAVVLSNLFPVLIAPLFNKFVPLEDEDLTARLTALAARADARVQGVFRFDMSRRTKSANAGLMGIGNTRRIVLGDTLLDEFSADEIETVLAHELGHHVHRDIWLGLTVQSAITLGGLYVANLGLLWGVNALGFEGISDIAALPIFALVMGAFGLVTMPLGNAYSRWRERMADRYALESTLKPDAFADAMTRLANQNLADADPEPWVEFILHSHPAIGKRVAAARAFAEATPEASG
jgi:STE24 endopeptidase